MLQECNPSGSIMEWTWCHYIMVEANIPPQNASHIHIRHIQSVWAHWHWYAFHRHTVIVLHHYWPIVDSVLSIWVTWGSNWCHYVMVEVDATILFKLLPKSIVDIFKVFEPWAIGMLSQVHMGAPLYHSTCQVGPRFRNSGFWVTYGVEMMQLC